MTGPTVTLPVMAPDEVIWAYLSEVPQMIAGTDTCQVFTHIDYPVRHWPFDAGPFDPADSRTASGRCA